MSVVSYEVADMFAERAGEGCAVGIVPDARALTAEGMLAVARKIGTTETAFVLPADPGADYRVRVFTPDGESPFGGHSCLGTAATLVRLGVLEPGPVVQQCGSALLRITATAHGGEITAGPAVATFNFQPMTTAEVAGTGPDFATGLKDAFVFAWDSQTRVVHARMFAPGYGMPEDPACASAALALGPWLLAAGHLSTVDGRHEFTIRQGVEMGRPAVMACSVTVHDGEVTATSVAGDVVGSARGELVLP